MRLIITEKPSAGVAYARALGVNINKGGYIECKKHIITWCIGHLVELADADVYDKRYKKWRVEDLPIIPQKWEYTVTPDKNKQFEIIQKLMNDPRITEVINACDSGREGELIFRLVYEKASCTKPVKRLWISSMEEKVIIDGFNNLKDGADYNNLYHSALCRAQADWICGVNFSRAFTKLYNKKLNVGRVQTPTLAMLCERNTAIENFVKEKYFNVVLNNIARTERLDSETEAESVKVACDGKTAVVTAVKREKKTINSPKLYDLTTLQREANRIYGFTAQQTLDYAQSLYENRCISYPRTDSRYLTEDMSVTATNMINVILQALPCFKGLEYTPDVKQVTDSAKVTDHFAIITTAALSTTMLENLPEGERKILLLIAGRLLCATADRHEYEAVTATIECNGFSFTASGKTIINNGWKAIERLLKHEQKNNDDTEENDTPLDLTEGQELSNTHCTILERYTKPPLAYTEDTLLSSMQRAAPRDDSVRQGTAPNSGFADGDIPENRQGLGTPATRAGIIEKLIKSGFMKREKKNITVTDDGAELVSIMPDSIKSATMTAEWENSLLLIAKGELSVDEFMRGIEKFTTDIIISAKENVNPDKVAKFDNKSEKIGSCPRCQADVCETPKAYSCACGFILWKSNKFFETAKKPFTKQIATALLKHGKVEVKDLYSPKKDRTYTAIVCLEDTGTYINFKLEFPKNVKGGK
jgi:DNA topoisomerase-3